MINLIFTPWYDGFWLGIMGCVFLGGGMTSGIGCIFNIQRFCLHDGPGIRTVVFFKGCNLKCPWCSNPESQNINPESMYDPLKKADITVGEYQNVQFIMTEILKDIKYYQSSGGGVTLSGGEVFCQAEFLLELIKECKICGVNIAIESSCYVSHDIFKKVYGYIDLMLVDLKHYNDAQHIKHTGVSLKQIIRNLKLIEREKLILRIPVIPGVNDKLEDAESFVALLNELDIRTITLLPFHQYGKNKYKLLKKNYEYQDVKSIDKVDLMCYKNVFISNSIECLL